MGILLILVAWNANLNDSFATLKVFFDVVAMNQPIPSLERNYIGSFAVGCCNGDRRRFSDRGSPGLAEGRVLRG